MKKAASVLLLFALILLLSGIAFKGNATGPPDCDHCGCRWMESVGQCNLYGIGAQCLAVNCPPQGFTYCSACVVVQ